VRATPLRLGSLLALLLGACGEPGAGVPAGTHRTFLTSEMKGFDPAHADEEISSVLVSNVYDTLYEYHHLDRPFRLVPCLAAADPEVSEDGLSWTIRLRRGVTFADDPCFPGGKGREVTASDVIFGWKRLMDRHVNSPGTWILEGWIRGLDAFAKASADTPRRRDRGSYPPEEGYPEVEGLQALDAHTLRVVLERPYPQFHWILAMPYTSVYPPEAVARYGEAFAERAVGTGPWTVESYVAAQKVVLVRRPGYREDRYPTSGSPGDEALGRLADAGRPLPLCERVVATVFKESAPQWLSFLAGEIDRTTVPKDNFDAAVDPETRALRPDMARRGIRLDQDPRLEVIYDCFNMLDPVLGQPNGARGRAIRAAISLAIDEEWWMRHLYNDRVTPVDGPILPEFPEHDPAFRNPWKRRADETREQARERARALLAEAGYPGGRGIPPIQYEVTDSETDRQFYLALRDDLKTVGIEVRARNTTWQEMVNRIRDAKAQMWGIAWGADYPEAQNFLQLFYGPNASPGPNGSNYRNPEFDALYERAQTMMPGPERTDLYRRMERIVVEEAVWVFRYRRMQFNLLHPWLHGYRYNDLVPKTFKYTRGGDAEGRRRPVWEPVALALGAGLALLALTLLTARRRPRAW
jgi:oligopeptide transport system substrate-binding protein